MRKRNKVLVAAVAGVLLLGAAAAIAGPVIYRDVVTPPAAGAPTLSAEDGALEPDGGEPLDPEALDGTWTLADGSEAGYRVDEVLNGTDVTVTGRTDEVSGSLTVEDLTITAAEFTVDVASIETDSPRRDAYFRDTALRADEHPTATFRLTEPVTAAGAPGSGETVSQEFVGELTIAGTTRTVTLTAEARTDGSSADIAGRIPISFADFGVEAPDLGFVSVEPDGFVEFRLVAERE